MPTKIVRYRCRYCGRQDMTDWRFAQTHEKDCRRESAARRIAVKKHYADLRAKGLSEWVEHGVTKTAPTVDPAKFGPHEYIDGQTADCRHNCGCGMGPSTSWGPVDPFGPCPNNPKEPPKEASHDRS